MAGFMKQRNKVAEREERQEKEGLKTAQKKFLGLAGFVGGPLPPSLISK